MKFKPGDRVVRVEDLRRPTWTHGNKVVTIAKVCASGVIIKEDKGSYWESST